MMRSLKINIIIFGLFFHKIVSLNICEDNESLTERKFCVVKNNSENYEPYDPDWKPGKPLSLFIHLTLVSIAEFNEDSILMNIILTYYWNDTRVTMTQPPQGNS